MERYLEIKWTISKAKDTYGYNVVTLQEEHHKAKFKTCGGGYDMMGTVFADWLWHENKEQIIAKCTPRNYNIKDNDLIIRNGFINNSEDYGFFLNDGKYWLDGACGYDCIVRIAKKIGLEISHIRGRKEIKYIVVKESQA